MAKAVKCRIDPTLEVYMKKEILKVINNDQVCFMEDVSGNEYKTRLRAFQKEKIDHILEVMKSNFDIELQIFDNMCLFEE